ncbi:DUF1415 domain-containing protein [Oxalobacteraceae bacterium CAVE-383]|nr:DUF1415 domain-containing protein [Oxalobacteraceae bacterium CAVE-383]
MLKNQKNSTNIDDPALLADPVFTATRDWLLQAVIGLNLCPFAKAVYVKRQIRYRITGARDTDALLNELCDELQLLAAADPEQIDTTLLIHPRVLADFSDYNDFLAIADVTLRNFGLEGVIQVASFHPQYQFDNSDSDDIENYTNRSPYPMLHLLREQSIARAVDGIEDADEIVERNMEKLRLLGKTGWNALPFVAQEK